MTRSTNITATDLWGKNERLEAHIKTCHEENSRIALEMKDKLSIRDQKLDQNCETIEQLRAVHSSRENEIVRLWAKIEKLQDCIAKMADDLRDRLAPITIVTDDRVYTFK